MGQTYEAREEMYYIKIWNGKKIKSQSHYGSYENVHPVLQLVQTGNT